MPLPPVSRQARDLSTMAAVVEPVVLLAPAPAVPMPDPGSAAQLAVLLPGAVGTIGTMKVERRLLGLLAALHRGLVTAVTAIVEAVVVTSGMGVTLITAVEILTVEALLRLAPLLGTRPPRLRQLTRVLTQAATAPMVLLRE